MLEWFRNVEGLEAAFVGWFFGLLALAIGVVLNAAVNRRRDDRLHGLEANAVAAALYGEILLLRQEIARAGNMAASIEMNLSYKRVFDRFYVEENPISEPTLYNALAPKLGMLPTNDVLAITEFHANLKRLRWWMPRMEKDKNRSYSYNILHILHPARDAVTKIEPTLRAIETRLEIAQPATAPDIKRVLDLIDMEEDILKGRREQNQVANSATN